MIIDIPRQLYDKKVIGNSEALKLYMLGERDFDAMYVRWTGTDATGQKLRQLLGI
jgi:hypothetical protein